MNWVGIRWKVGGVAASTAWVPPLVKVARVAPMEIKKERLNRVETSFLLSLLRLVARRLVLVDFCLVFLPLSDVYAWCW